jgi:predicted nucleotidyltransferase
MRHQFDAFIDDLRATHGRNLASVILYGSAAAGDFVPHQSDYNILIALHKITLKDLRSAQAPMREWNRLGHSAPVYFTVDELDSAADVFPIEFHQMERARIVLYGTDVLANLKISDEYLRHQTEYELRSKLILLRRQYIAVSTSVSGLVNLMAESLWSFTALFRAVLIIHGFEPPVTKPEIVQATVGQLKLDNKPFEKIFEIREKNASKTLDEVSANTLFADYMQQIENVIEAVDKIRKD